MAIFDSDVVLAIWLDEPKASKAISVIYNFSQREILSISTFNALEVLIRSSTILDRSFSEDLNRIKEIAKICPPDEKQLLLICEFRVYQPKLSLGDAYAASLAFSKREKLITTDGQFLKVQKIKGLVELV